MMPPGIPHGLDADTTQRIARTFLVVRIVRGSLLLLFLAIALVAVELKNWPQAVAVGIALTMLLLAGGLVRATRAASATRSKVR